MIHVIAEAGTNHNGSEEEARRLIDIAASAGADSVKFQIINPWGLYLPGEYDYGPYRIQDVLALRHSTVLSDDVYRRLAGHARSVGIPMSASVFDAAGLELLESLHPPYVKIASTDLNNLRFLRVVAASPLRMILSTGMSEMGEIDRAVRTVEAIRGLESVVLMHCVSVYPCPTAEMNLWFVETLAREFGTEVGLSDHSQSSVAAVAAVGLGVTWVEKHFTRDRTQRGLDHAYALEQSELSGYVADLRDADRALQPSGSKVGAPEEATRRRARRALYAARDIAAGEVIADADVLCVRPEGPMSAEDIDFVVGSRAVVAIGKHIAFRPELISR